MNTPLLALLALCLHLPLVAVDKTPKKNAPLYFPPADGPWEKVDPAKIGWDLAKLKDALSYFGENKSSGVVILHRGRILAEQYWPLKTDKENAKGGLDPYFHMRLGENAAGRAIEDVASVQKSVTAMLVGMAQSKGLLKLDDPVIKHLGKGWSQAPAGDEAKITIRHLVTMTSGLDSRLKFRVPAGTNWFYNTAAYSRALSCVAKASKTDPNEFTKKWLTEPIGMKDTHWAVRPWQASVRTDANRYGFATTARDLARFGLLMLANGHWGKENVLGDKDYIRAATSSSQKLNPSYGYLWWLNGGPFTTSGKRVRPGRLISAAPKDMYVAQGKLVRRLYVLPTQQVVITRLGDQANPDFNAELFRRLRLASGN
jgi:CubicO group peptidase (beta-lactamase class C family)